MLGSLTMRNETAKKKKISASELCVYEKLNVNQWVAW